MKAGQEGEHVVVQVKGGTHSIPAGHIFSPEHEGLPSLPVKEILPRLAQALTEKGVAVLVAPPGSGKTTRVPLALRDASWLEKKKIVMLEPRRIAARLAATYMAGLLGEEVGTTVGYQVRFERRISAATRVEVITEGLLTRRLQQDPELKDVGLVVFDEFHERSLDADLALALCLEVRAALRDDLRVLVMSATMDAGPVSRLLGNAPVIESKGRMYPVQVRHIPPPAGEDSKRPDHLARSATRAIREIRDRESGDMLVFLPGTGEIKRVAGLLGESEACVVRPLHGSLHPTAQERAIVPDPAGRQRIILATTIAETSVTIEGITVVVDCGWKRVPRYHAATGLTGLDTVRISRASAEQRAGRAGRLAPGVCYRLWHSGVEAGLQDFDNPEIMQADLTPLMLELASWGAGSPDELAWLNRPPENAVNQGKKLLQDLGALDGRGRITPLGREMSGLPLHPRLAAMVILAGAANRDCAVDLAALLSERDPLPGSETADIEQRLYCLHRFRTRGRRDVQAMGGNPGVCGAITRISKQLKRLLGRRQSRSVPSLSVGAILALAYPDRIGKRRRDTGCSYRLRSGAGGALLRHDPLAAASWLVVASQNMHSRDGRIFLAAALTEEELVKLFRDRFDQTEEVFWDREKQSVVSRECVRLGTLVVSEQTISCADSPAVMQALLAGIRELGLNTLPWSRRTRQLQARLCCLREWQPQDNWPDFSDVALLADLEQWLAPFLTGIVSLKGCRKLDLEAILRSRLNYGQQQSLKQNAPTHIQVPSNSRIKLEYQPGKPPVLAVRLQEMFGLAETPTVCRGQIKVVLHLLSPARRPVQITQDLRGFWDLSYFEVRKELQGRYPKHHWPMEPWKAAATARVKPRKKK